MLQPLKRQAQVLISQPRLLVLPKNPNPLHESPFSTSTTRPSFWSDLTSSVKSKSPPKTSAQPPTTTPITETPSESSSKPKNPDPSIVKTTATTPPPHHKTVAESDAEMLEKLEGISGEGGASGVEYEDGKASGLKRGVKDNMFRVI